MKLKKISGPTDGGAKESPEGIGTVLNSKFWEHLYFLFVIKMNRSEEEFFKFNTRKVIFLVEKYADQFKTEKAEIDSKIREVSSMTEFLRG